MGIQISRRVIIIGSLFLVAMIVLSGSGAAHSGTSSQNIEAKYLTTPPETLDSLPIQSDRLGAQIAEVQKAEQAADESEEWEGDEAEEEDSDKKAGATLLGDWWGLGGEVAETPYIGLVEIGVIILGIGLGGYTLGKRTSLLPSQYRRYLLPAHEWTMLVGTGLTVPHFFVVEEWEGLGFLVGILLAVEVLSGFYGRHLHRHVIRIDRGSETDPLLGRLIEISKETLFSRWRQVHISLTLVTGLVFILHIVTAIGE